MGKKKTPVWSIEVTQDAIKAFLAHNVPRFIAEIQSRGGISEEEFKWLQGDDEEIDSPSYMIARADELLLYPKTMAVLEKSLFTLTLTIALMAHFPNGVEFFGIHFCSQQPE